MSYPSSFRCKVLSVRKKEGLTITQVAARFCMGIASVTRWVKNPNPKQTRNKPATKIDMYLPEDSGILIVRILHQRMDFKRHLPW